MAVRAFFFCMQLLLLRIVSSEISFTYNGFTQANMSLDGAAFVRPDGILAVTNDTTKILGHAFYPSPLQFKDQNGSSVSSFSTNFIFSMNPKYPELGGHGLAFVIWSAKEPPGCLSNQYLGLPNGTSNAQSKTKVVAVEFDTVQNMEFSDINDNHVGIDFSNLISNISEPASYYVRGNREENIPIILKSGDPVQAWIEYSHQEKLLSVTVSPLGILRPFRPLLSIPIDLSPLMDDYMYAGFSASTGLLSAAHNVLGWSFKIGGKGKASDLDPSKLPSPLPKPQRMVHTKGFAAGIAISSVALVLLVLFGVFHILKRIRNGDDELEEWEVEYGAHRFKYSVLLAATSGFGESNLVGSGGFGRVYRGIIPKTGLEVAIKRVAHDSRQGMREFVAEVTSMGRLRHRNLVELHGWCRRKDELLLVYEYIPNGSLDKLLQSDDYLQKRKLLNWDQRYKILTGVAQALLYLHEECDEMVIHRDVKPSNVLIDADLNARLGDFGLARTYEHGINPQTTKVVGTLGYLAPELTRTGQATASTDVYGYGALMLEVATGRRPIEPQRIIQELVLVDWVRVLHSQGEIIRALDPILEDYNSDEADLILSLGLLCTHPNPDYRPSMRKVVQLLLGDAFLPPLPSDLHLEAAGVIIDFSDIPGGESDPSCSRGNSSKSTSFSSSGVNKVSFKQVTRVTF